VHGVNRWNEVDDRDDDDAGDEATTAEKDGEPGECRNPANTGIGTAGKMKRFTPSGDTECIVRQRGALAEERPESCHPPDDNYYDIVRSGVKDFSSKLLPVARG
jgi:hypothetical protein